MNVQAHEPANSNRHAACSQQEAGEANLLRLRDTDREHRVKVCVLAPRYIGINGRAVDNQLTLDVALEYLSYGLSDRGVITQIDENDVSLCGGFFD